MISIENNSKIKKKFIRKEKKQNREENKVKFFIVNYLQSLIYFIFNV